MILGKAVGKGGGGDLFAAELVDQNLIEQFKEKHVVVKYVRGILFVFFSSQQMIKFFVKVFQDKQKRNQFNIFMMKLQLIGIFMNLFIDLICHYLFF